MVNNSPIVIGEEGIRKAEDKESMSFDKISLELNLKRPKLTPLLSKTFYIELNLQLPESEILEYLELVKKEYDRENIKNNIEHFKKIRLAKKKLKKANSDKFADMLYIYDCYQKHNKTKFKSASEFYAYLSDALYHSYTREVRKDISRNTTETYIETMKEYIEDTKYLELLVGIVQQ